MVEKPVNPKCGLRVECVINRHDNTPADTIKKTLPNYER